MAKNSKKKCTGEGSACDTCLVGRNFCDVCKDAEAEKDQYGEREQVAGYRRMSNVVETKGGHWVIDITATDSKTLFDKVEEVIGYDTAGHRRDASKATRLLATTLEPGGPTYLTVLDTDGEILVSDAVCCALWWYK